MLVNEKGIGVLEEYPIEVRAVRKGRGILIVDTGQGLKKLVEFKGVEAHADFQNAIQESLWITAGIKTDRFVKTKEEGLITVDRDGKKYVLKEHIEGVECDLKNQQDIFALARNLARLHKHLKLPKEIELQVEPFSHESLKAEFEKHNRELRKIRRFVRERSAISTFETRFLKEFEQFYTEGVEALELLSSSRYETLRDNSTCQRMVCHGDYNYHNVLFEKNEKATVNFEKCHIGIQMEDLYDFMRKILEKNNWDIKLGRKILAEYRSIREITTEEQENLYIRLMYPEKFWKLANQYYNSNKAWISGKTIEKLEVTTLQNNKKQEFLKKFREF